MATLPGFWLQRRLTWQARLLWPLGALYGLIARARRHAYRAGWLRRGEVDVPVVVVGNIFVGGTGKTPMVAWVVRRLQALGRNPGIVSRGYGGRARTWPQDVHPDSDPVRVGDEPLLLARQTGCPVVVGPDRVAAAQRLVAAGCDVIVSDDGLQHYRLPRALELAICDGARGLGNGLCLPAGPLREPPARLATVDLVISNGRAPELTPAWFDLVPGRLHPAGPQAAGARSPAPGATVDAVAGIGHPERFFATLETMDYRVIRHSFPDHHAYQPADLAFAGERPVVMTEKDAVKCARFAAEDTWYLPVEARPDKTTTEKLEARLAGLDCRRNR